MSYTIHYTEGSNIRRLKGKTALKSNWLLFLPVFAVLFRILFPDTATAIRDILLPGFDKTGAEAFSQMVSSLQNGDSFLRSMTAFCHSVVGNAAI